MLSRFRVILPPETLGTCGRAREVLNTPGTHLSQMPSTPFMPALKPQIPPPGPGSPSHQMSGPSVCVRCEENSAAHQPSESSRSRQYSRKGAEGTVLMNSQRCGWTVLTFRSPRLWCRCVLRLHHHPSAQKCSS